MYDNGEVVIDRVCTVACCNKTGRAVTVKILFTSAIQTSFIREDLDLLRKHFEVDPLLTSGVYAVVDIALRVPRADVTLTWFASAYSAVVVFCARLLGKKSLLVIGGVDASKDKEIEYGIWLTPWKAMLVKWAMRHAHKLLVVDPFFVGEIKRLAEYDGRNIEYVPTGYDATRWYPSGTKKPFVLTVAACHDELRMRKKGLDVLWAAAQNLPDVRFVIVGLQPDLAESVRTRVPPNVDLVPFVERQRLLSLYQHAKVYCQPSFTEGLPNSLCEAMLCACVPVGTNVGGIPTAIGDIGFLVPYGDVAALTSAISGALDAPDSTGAAARDRIAGTFTLERREEALIRLLQEAAQ